MQPQKFVLCVADDYDTRLVISALLSQHGFEVAVADSFLTGLLLAQARPFHLYILDTYIGGKPGVELLKSIRVFDPLTPAVFFSSVAGEPARHQALAAGAAAYVNQPDCEGLLDAITHVCAPAQGVK